MTQPSRVPAVRGAPGPESGGSVLVDTPDGIARLPAVPATERTAVIRTDRPTGEPRLSAAASWAVLAASFGLSAATWVALAELAGFTSTATIDGVTVSLSWLMPVAVDGYLVVALVLWMAPVPTRVARFARANTYAAAFVGVTAQSAYHALTTAQAHPDQLWRAGVALVVGALPPGVAALAVHMRALIVRESAAPTEPAPVVVPDTTPDIEAAPVAAIEAPEPAGVDDDVSAGSGVPDTRPAPDEAARIARALRAGDPDMSLAQIGRLLGRDERTVRRYLNQPVKAGAPELEPALTGS